MSPQVPRRSTSRPLSRATNAGHSACSEGTTKSLERDTRGKLLHHLSGSSLREQIKRMIREGASTQRASGEAVEEDRYTAGFVTRSGLVAQSRAKRVSPMTQRSSGSGSKSHSKTHSSPAAAKAESFIDHELLASPNNVPMVPGSDAVQPHSSGEGWQAADLASTSGSGSASVADRSSSSSLGLFAGPQSVHITALGPSPRRAKKSTTSNSGGATTDDESVVHKRTEWLDASTALLTPPLEASEGEGSSIAANSTLSIRREAQPSRSGLYSTFDSPALLPTTTSHISGPTHALLVVNAANRSRESSMGATSSSMGYVSAGSGSQLAVHQASSALASPKDSPHEECSQDMTILREAAEGPPINLSHDVSPDERPSWAIEAERQHSNLKALSAPIEEVDEDVLREYLDDRGFPRIVRAAKQSKEEQFIRGLLLRTGSSSEVEYKSMTEASFGLKDISGNPRLAEQQREAVRRTLSKGKAAAKTSFSGKPASKASLREQSTSGSSNTRRTRSCSNSNSNTGSAAKSTRSENAWKEADETASNVGIGERGGGHNFATLTRMLPPNPPSASIPRNKVVPLDTASVSTGGSSGGQSTFGYSYRRPSGETFGHP